MFKNVTLRLTVSYMCVVMVISLVFSAVVYRVGSNNLVAGLNRESQELSSAFPIFSGTQYASPDYAALNSGRHHLLDELVLINLFVLVGAGFICYILAKETLKPIEQAHEQQKRFTADVSHELRTPLTALKMESEVALMDDKLAAKELRLVLMSNIEEAAKLDSLINNLLRLTRLEAGELQQQFGEIDLKELARDAIAQVSSQANPKKVAIKLTGNSVKLQGDRDSLSQMLVIFLDNAIKYSPAKSTVEVKLKNKGNLPNLTIQDHGEGIEAKDLEHIFERFYRSDTARSGNSGYGLGLSIAKLIADVHHANITISSQIGHGTTVSVNFTT